MPRFQAKIRTALYTTAALGMSAAAVAQTAPATPPAPPAGAATAPAQTATVTNDQIHSFAAAYLQVQKIQKDYAPQVQAAKGAQEDALKEKANQEMAAAVKGQGLDPQTFNTISQAAESDQRLRQKIGQEVAKIQASAGAR